MGAGLQIFIENKAGSCSKNEYDPRTLSHLGSSPVSLPYPYPYGFVVGTVAGDGDSVDCFVLTETELLSGETIDCRAVALIEQVEDGEVDHKVIGVPVGENGSLDDATAGRLIAFIQGVFAHIPGKRMEVGRVLGAPEAEAFVEASRDFGSTNSKTVPDARSQGMGATSAPRSQHHAKDPD